MHYYVYILKSESTGRSYTGHSKDLNNRVAEHNNGKSIATRGKGPWKLVYYEEFETRSDAMKYEYYLKSRPGRIKLKEEGIL